MDYKRFISNIGDIIFGRVVKSAFDKVEGNVSRINQLLGEEISLLFFFWVWANFLQKCHKNLGMVVKMSFQVSRRTLWWFFCADFVLYPVIFEFLAIYFSRLRQQFQQEWQNCILRVQKHVLEKNMFTVKKNENWHHFRTEIFFAFLRNVFNTVIKSSFVCPCERFKENLNFEKL